MILSATIAGASSGRKLEIRSSVTSVSGPGSCISTISSSQKPTTTHLVRRPLANLRDRPQHLSLTLLFHALAQRLVERVVTAVELRLEVRGEHHRGQPARALLRHDEAHAPVMRLDLEGPIDVEDARPPERREPAQLAVGLDDGHARLERHLQPAIQPQLDLQLLPDRQPPLRLADERVPVRERREVGHLGPHALGGGLDDRLRLDEPAGHRLAGQGGLVPPVPGRRGRRLAVAADEVQHRGEAVARDVLAHEHVLVPVAGVDHELGVRRSRAPSGARGRRCSSP